MKIGNPYAAKFGGLKLTLRYGKDLRDYLNQQVVSTPATELPATTWTNFDVTISPAKAEDLRLMYIEIDSEVVSLARSATQ